MNQVTVNFALHPMEAELVLRGVAKLSIEEGGALFQKLQMQFRDQVMGQAAEAAQATQPKAKKAEQK